MPIVKRYEGRWQEAQQFCFFDYPIKDLAGSTIGIIGDGVLGQAVANMARGLGMRVIFAGYKGHSGLGSLYVPFEQTLAEADILTLHCPLLPETRNMIGAPEFALMRRKPLLINTARGGWLTKVLWGRRWRQGTFLEQALMW